MTTYATLTKIIPNNAGIACLTQWFADNNPKLKRLTADIGEAAMDVWVLIHPDLRGVKRITALKELLVGIFEAV